MSAILECALSLAQQKVRFFPCRQNSKLPAIADFSSKASSDPETLTQIFSSGAHYNSGIACGKVAENLYLVGFDIDLKPGRNGFETLELMEELGDVLPPTWRQKTPSGGEHRLFWSTVPIKQGVNIVGQGIDLRSDGGYLVGPGSELNGIFYQEISRLPIAFLPAWAVRKWQKIATVHSITPPTSSLKFVSDQITAMKRSVEYVQGLDPVREGGRNDACFKVCARMKDFGLDPNQMVEVLLNNWACHPMLELAELHAVVNSVFKYSLNPAGTLAPENMFQVEKDPLEKTPIERYNEKFFYFAGNGVSRVCWETEDDFGQFDLERYPVHIFHEKHVAEKMLHNGKQVPISKVWMEHPERRTYDRMGFYPGFLKNPKTYNLWRGFSVKPDPSVTDPKAHEAVKLFLEHVEKNLCDGKKDLAQWLLGYMAHIFQRPEEKPEVALVFQGEKGTGKTIVSTILNHLIGKHSVILANRSHFLGNFNSVMEDKLLVTLDEAFWSGHKDSEGTLKDIVTGKERVITYKGQEPYSAKVYDRIVIIGNEQWLVSATADERRWAVFNVGKEWQQNRKIFGTILNGLFKHGGDKLLMQYFMSMDLSNFDPNCAPLTDGLAEQKIMSLNVFEQWWFRCLQEGEVLGSGEADWPDSISAKDLYSAFALQTRTDNPRIFTPNNISVGRNFHRISRLCGGTKNTTGNVRKHFFAPIDICRAEWEEVNKCKGPWNEP